MEELIIDHLVKATFNVHLVKQKFEENGKKRRNAEVQFVEVL